jgi:adrenodoxin-NADP+ reductase
MQLARPAPFICRECRRFGLPKKQHTNTAWRVYSTRQRPIHVAIIGSGPAGFFSAYRLLKKLPHSRIDMYEHLPVPYGLARYGVAPDHPEVKVCLAWNDERKGWVEGKKLMRGVRAVEMH